MKTRAFLLHALSPLHAGTGHAAGVIDLPTARMKATGIPFVPGSSIKGVLRDARGPVDSEKTEAVFGPPSESADAHAGALVVGDARLLALPVRSFRGTFAWVTSPLLLALSQWDLRDAGLTFAVPSLDGRAALVARGSMCLYRDRLYLEDLDLPAKESPELGAWAAFLARLTFPGEDIFTRRFAVVDDETMTFLWDTGTQVDARVRLGEQRTVARGALWLEESLPPETLLVGLMAGDRSRKERVPMTPDEVLSFALPSEEIRQMGGKATTGRGRCRVVPILAAGKEGSRVQA
jgi:CRISPR-associated protein Cmr4